MKSLFILGRQPAIGRAELESLYGAEPLSHASGQAVVGDFAASNVDFARLGSTVKLGEVLGTVSSVEWPKVQREAIKLATARVQDFPEGKVQLGISAYGLHVNSRQLTAAGLEVKKALRKAGYSGRLVPNQGELLELSSAQVLHNKLAGERGLEILLVRSDDQTIVGRTLHIQDINAYAARDQGRPKRDARVGMLPPKLAQTIVNLATAKLTPSSDTIVLDPFCGTGVILQEALLMGYGAYGTDLEPRMVDYTQTNLDWLNTYASDTSSISSVIPARAGIQLEIGDAASHTWQHPFKTIACETYLGHPFSSWPTPDKLQDVIGTCNLILEKFLRGLRTQIPSGTRLCLAIPAWLNPNGRIHHLSLLDRIDDLGYNRVSFVGVSPEEMVYHRPEQIVARELLVITRK